MSMDRIWFSRSWVLVSTPPRLLQYKVWGQVVGWAGQGSNVQLLSGNEGATGTTADEKQLRSPLVRETGIVFGTRTPVTSEEDRSASSVRQVVLRGRGEVQKNPGYWLWSEGPWTTAARRSGRPHRGQWGVMTKTTGAGRLQSRKHSCPRRV